MKRLPEVFGVDVCAEQYFGGSTLAVRKRVERRAIPYRRVGGRIMFCGRELAAWWEALEGVPVDEAVARAREGRRG